MTQDLKKMLASWGRAFLTAALALVAAGETDPENIAYAIFIGGLRYLVRGWLWTLTPNGGSSLADRLARIETRQEQMMELLKK